MLRKDAVLSGTVLGLVAILYLVQFLYGDQALAFYAQALAVLVAAMWVWALVARQMKRDLVPKLAFLEPLDEAKATEMFKKSLVLLNKGLGFAKKVYLGQDLVRSAGTAAVLFAASQVLRVFSVLTLTCLSVAVGMTWPIVYEKHADKIDAVVAKVQADAAGLYDKHVRGARAPTRPPTTTPAPAAEPAKTKKNE